MVKLALPTAIFWITGFFAVFHSYLNIISELLYYGDRQFYLEWWNCKNLAEYWRLWNLPVHNFFVRHVAYPLQLRVC